MRMPSCVLHPSHDSVACRFSFMLHCSCHKVSFSHFLSPLPRVSLWFFLCWYSSVCWVPVFVSFLCGAHGYNPDHTLLKHFQKTQHKLNHFMNTCILSTSYSRSVGFRHLLRHKRLWNQHWKGREEKVLKCFENYDREWRLCHCATYGGIIPSKGWLPKMEAGILQAPNLD